MLIFLQERERERRKKRNDLSVAIAAGVASSNWSEHTMYLSFFPFGLLILQWNMPFHNDSNNTIALSLTELINTGMLKIYRNNTQTQSQSNARMQTIELSERGQTHARSPAPVVSTVYLLANRTKKIWTEKASKRERRTFRFKELNGRAKKRN